MDAGNGSYKYSIQVKKSLDSKRLGGCGNPIAWAFRLTSLNPKPTPLMSKDNCVVDEFGLSYETTL